MRIAFVGKGGSGKTTLTSLFIQYLEKNASNNIWLVDADLNIHIANMLRLVEVSPEKHLSSSMAQTSIKEYLVGKNARVKSLGHFKKTTPPTAESGLVDLSKVDNFIFDKFAYNRGNLYFSVVGAYQGEGIGTSCYHNNLSIFENILSHSIDKDQYIVVDMVAGIDAFAGTLHSQFDLLVMSVEPTKRSVQVFEQYMKLAEEAGVLDQLYAIGNKVRGKRDIEFLRLNIPNGKLFGLVEDSEHIRNVDQEIEALSAEKIGNQSLETLSQLNNLLKSNQTSPDQRLKKLYELHERYVAQGYVKDRFGDLMNQIDDTFSFEQV